MTDVNVLRILVTGSRDWGVEAVVEAALRAAHLKYGPATAAADTVVVHGGYRGADACAARAASRLGFQVEEHRADWATHGREAGPIRNAQMVAAGADVCVAFPLVRSRGTRHCMSLAKAAGIPVLDYGDDSERARG